MSVSDFSIEHEEAATWMFTFFLDKNEKEKTNRLQEVERSKEMQLVSLLGLTSGFTAHYLALYLIEP